jgi:hypothetical protein
MTTYDFQLTYSISPYGEDKSTQARTLLREEIEGWNTVNGIETTLVGKIKFSCSANENKREKAQEIIEDKIRTLFNNKDVLDHSYSRFSLMVDGLGEHITFIL